MTPIELVLPLAALMSALFLPLAITTSALGRNDKLPAKAASVRKVSKSKRTKKKKAKKQKQYKPPPLTPAQEALLIRYYAGRDGAATTGIMPL